MSVRRAEFNFLTFDTESVEQVFRYQTGDPLTPIDLTGASFSMEIRDGGPDGALLLTLSTANGRIVIDADQVTNTGVFTVFVNTTDMANILTVSGQSSGSYDYDLKFTSASGTQAKVLFGGQFQIERSVTRA